MDRHLRVAGSSRQRRRREAPRGNWVQRIVGNGGAAALLGAIVGGVITGGTTIWVGDMQQDGETERQIARLAEENRDEQAALREDAYKAFLDASQAHERNAIARIATCKPGTDEPLSKDQPCVVPLLSTYEGSRYDVQSAINEVHRVGSEDGIAAMRTVASALPPTLYELGFPVEEMPDTELFSVGFDALLDIRKCETVPVPPRWCPADSEYGEEQAGP
ncbi:hypothetical protein [Promicromonospora sp. NFX87]|uniref:hypothetical protein n=1 Tax=Promicromonospora sp. NFX87 TaxID=3402691 RepID=UPI003AFAB378